MDQEKYGVSGVRVIMDELENRPFCPHGPTLLFERQNVKFFACSACRNRKDCPVYILHESWIKHKTSNKFKNLPNLETYVYSEEIVKMVSLGSSSQVDFCHTCSTLFVRSDEINAHENHDILINIDRSCVLNPSKLFKPLEDSKKEAQYLFSNDSVDVIMKILQQNKLRNIICLGTPRIHERIQQNKKTDMKSILLDIDGRHGMFYPSKVFFHFNIFNNHFFNEEDIKHFEDFSQNDNGQNFCLIMDPPFGGRIEPLAHTLQKISTQSASLNGRKDSKLLPLMLTMPYFMEPQIKNHIQDMEMSDYQIAYKNHSKFQITPKTKQKSVVRMFTNIPLSNVPLPDTEGYKFCKICLKWIGSWNKHCTECDACTSKNGSAYRHCKICAKCVKPAWIHCDKCSRCHLSQHLCGTLPNNQICFNCQETGHKKVDCPALATSMKRKHSNEPTNQPYKLMKANKELDIPHMKSLMKTNKKMRKRTKINR